jgi:hypothetical protein
MTPLDVMKKYPPNGDDRFGETVNGVPEVGVIRILKSTISDVKRGPIVPSVVIVPDRDVPFWNA